ncbi:MAG: hypothetical protein Q4A79_01335, partial [Candidatus Saccharibacteria bacterium]|nr:hypothetical protein [Candidatus Saccharibacteria bacterium]
EGGASDNSEEGAENGGSEENEGVEENDGTVKSFKELNAAVCQGGEIKLGANIMLDRWLGAGCDYFFSRDLTIDFNGFTITSDETHGWNVDVRGATLTFKDSVGGGGYTQLGDNNLALMLTNATLVLDGGILDVTTWGVTLFHDSKLVMNGGEIKADGFAITGNGTTNPASGNYGSNTKITINGGKIVSESDYAIYHPQENGVMVVNGGEITGAAGAIAANRGNITINGGTLRSLGTAEAEGDVSQDGTRGYSTAVIGIAKEYGPVNLTITGGDFIAEGGAEMIADPSGLDNSNEAKVEISGGIFSTLPEFSQVAEGYDIYDLSEDGPYEVDKKIELNLPSTTYLQVGDTEALNFDELTKKYATMAGVEGVFEVEGDTIRATGLGVKEAQIDLHNHIYREDNRIRVVVYEVVAKENDDILNDADRERVRALVAEDIKNVIRDGIIETDYMDVRDIDWLLRELAGGETITTEMELNLIKVGGFAQYVEAGSDVAEEISEDETVVATYTGYVRVRIGGVTVALVYELPEDIMVELEIPEEYLEVPEGYERIFEVIRGHLALDDTTTATRLATERVGDKLHFNNSRFSSFVITYTDAVVPVGEPETEIEAPNTGMFTKETKQGGAQNFSGALVIFMAVVTLSGVAVVIRRGE